MTREKVMELFYVLRANPKVSINKIDGLLCIIPKVKIIPLSTNLILN